MSRISWNLGLSLAAAVFVLAGTQRASAQVIVTRPAYYAAPAVTYYSPAPVFAPVQQVSYYAPPMVSYAPSVSYYAPPVTYAAPAVSYYAPAVPAYVAPVSAMTTTRYGLFGVPRQTTTYYYPR